MKDSLSRILIENKKGNYSIAKFAKSRTNLKPGKKEINKRELNQTGYIVKYTTYNPPLESNYPPLSLKQDYEKNKKYFARECLENFLGISNQMIENKEADYILLKNMESKEMGEERWKKWQVSANIHLMKLT
jgi:hypothetical protein